MSALVDSATQLLKLLETHHQAMHFISAGGTDGLPFVQIMIPVEELNKISQGMAVLASLVQLNPAFVAEEQKGKKHA